MMSSGVIRSGVPWTVPTIGTGLFGLGLAVGGYGAYVSVLIAEGVAPAAAGLGMTLFLFGQLSAVLPADHLTRRFAVERIAALGLLIGAIGIGLSGTTDLPMTYASRLLLGLGQGTAFLAGIKYVGLRTSMPERATAQGLLGATFTLGLAVGIAATRPAIDGLGLAPPALVAAAITAGGGLTTWRLTTVDGGGALPLRAYLEPLIGRAAIALGLANMAAFGFLMVVATWYNELLAGGTLPVTAILAGFALATVVGRGVGGYLAGVVGQRTTVVAGLVGLAVVLCGLAGGLYLEVDGLIGLAVIASGLGFGIPFGPLFSLAFSTLVDDPGVTLTIMLVLGNGGALVYPWLVGWLLAVTAGYAAGFVAMALTVACIAGLWSRWIGPPPT